MILNGIDNNSDQYKIVNRDTINSTVLRSLQKELTYKQVEELYKISSETLLKICDKVGLKFRKAKKKVVVETIQDINLTISEINVEFDEITL